MSRPSERRAGRAGAAVVAAAAVALVAGAGGCGRKVDFGTHTAALEGFACAACHLDRYRATTAPDHEAAGLPTTCEACHGTAAWSPALAPDHDLFWPLEGVHETTPCESCHPGLVYGGTPRACDGCHRPEYDATTSPAHAAAGLPTTCDVCHTPFGWVPATFDHDAVWPLTGRHAGAACEGCHAGGLFAGTPRACDGCHTPDYEATVSPDHATLGLSKACETCHTTAGWRPAQFPQHDGLFPITSGDHKRYRTDCAACHPSAETSWATFTCIGCHDGAHARARMDAKHLGEVGGYASKMAAAPTPDHGCLGCHPDGRAEDD